MTDGISMNDLSMSDDDKFNISDLNFPLNNNCRFCDINLNYKLLSNTRAKFCLN